MQEIGFKNPAANLDELGLKNLKTAYWNLSPEELMEHSISKGMGHLADSGALVISTGEFTGRSPDDRFIVKDSETANKVNWGKVNIPFESRKFDALWRKCCNYLKKKDVYVRDVRANASANTDYHLRIRVVTEYPWSNQFANNMFLRPDLESLRDHESEHIAALRAAFLAP